MRSAIAKGHPNGQPGWILKNNWIILGVLIFNTRTIKSQQVPCLKEKAAFPRGWGAPPAQRSGGSERSHRSPRSKQLLGFMFEHELLQKTHISKRIKCVYTNYAPPCPEDLWQAQLLKMLLLKTMITCPWVSPGGFPGSNRTASPKSASTAVKSFFSKTFLLLKSLRTSQETSWGRVYYSTHLIHVAIHHAASL